MVVSPVPWLVVLGCSYLLIQDIGPGLSLYTVGAQGKIGPHRYERVIQLNEERKRPRREEREFGVRKLKL